MSTPRSQTIPLPDLPDGAPKAPPPGRYKPQFGVIVLVENERAQAAVYEAFNLLGLKTRVVST